ncbi:MAG: hypothetical protein SGILL_005567 [Bacillariaceae sp.]
MEGSDASSDCDEEIQVQVDDEAEDDIEAPPVSASKRSNNDTNDDDSEEADYDDEEDESHEGIDMARELQDRKFTVISYGIFVLSSALYVAMAATSLPFYRFYDGVPKVIRDADNDEYWWAWYRTKDLIPESILAATDVDVYNSWFSNSFYKEKNLFMVPNSDLKFEDPENTKAAWVSQVMALYFCAAVGLMWLPLDPMLRVSGGDYLKQASAAVAMSVFWLLASLAYLIISSIDLRMMKKYVAEGCPVIQRTVRAMPGLQVATETSQELGVASASPCVSANSSPKKHTKKKSPSSARKQKLLADDESEGSSVQSQSHFKRNIIVVVVVCVILIGAIVGIVLGTKNSKSSPATPVPTMSNDPAIDTGVSTNSGLIQSDTNLDLPAPVSESCEMEMNNFTRSEVVLTMSVASDISATEIQYAADIFGKTYGGSSLIGFCDPKCRKINDVYLQEATVFRNIFENGSQVSKSGSTCNQEVKITISTGGSFYGCPEEQFPGLFSDDLAIATRTLPLDSECQVCTPGRAGPTPADLLDAMKRYLTILGSVCDLVSLEVEDPTAVP